MGTLRIFQDTTCTSLQVYSNAGVWQDGALRVRPFHNEKSPHGCPRCPPNLCKGQVSWREHSCSVVDVTPMPASVQMKRAPCSLPGSSAACLPAHVTARKPFFRCLLQNPRCTADRLAEVCLMQVLDSITTGAPYDRVAYLGDGSGDFCPCMRLQSSDYIIARECYPTGAHDSTRTALNRQKLSVQYEYEHAPGYFERCSVL